MACNYAIEKHGLKGLAVDNSFKSFELCFKQENRTGKLEMMIEEFTARTGYKPTWEEYRAIEQQYYDFDGNKDAFCQIWKDKQWARDQVIVAINDRLNKVAKHEGKTPRVKALAEFLDTIVDLFIA